MSDRKESSLAFSARVDVIALAKVAKFLTNEGYRVRTMSQLINWSVQYLESILSQNGHSYKMDFVDASKLLIELGVMNPNGRNNKKIAASTRLSMLRREGYDPEISDPRTHNFLNNRHSVQPIEIDDSDSAYSTAQIMNRTEASEKLKQAKDRAINSFKKAGFTADSEEKKRDYKPDCSTFEEIQQRDAEQDSELDELIKQRKGE
jgi:hypothetical protein